MAHAREHARNSLGNGHTEVRIYVDATTIASVVVADDFLDGPGYQDMLDLRLKHHQGLVAITEGSAP